MRAYQTYTSGNLFAVRYLAEALDSFPVVWQGDRRVQTPQLFIIDFNDELGLPRFEPITWSAARTLQPDAVADLGLRMSADREAYKRWLEEQGGPDKVGWPK